MPFLEAIQAISAGELAARAARVGGRIRDLGLGFVRGVGQGLGDLVYPPSCPVCHAATAEPRALCAACWARLRLIERPYCERLGTPFSVEMGARLVSPAAIADPAVYERARAAVRYDDVARALAHRLKFGDRLDLAATLGSWMARAGAELLADADLIVPVPLPRRETLQPGGAACRCGRPPLGEARGPFPADAVPPHATAGLSRAERQNNLSGAFLVPEETKARLAGLRVLLIDAVRPSTSPEERCCAAAPRRSMFLFSQGLCMTDLRLHECGLAGT